MWVKAMDGTLLNLDFFVSIKAVKITYGGLGAPIARWEIRAYRADGDKFGYVLSQTATEEEAVKKCEQYFQKLSEEE